MANNCMQSDLAKAAAFARRLMHDVGIIECVGDK